jgi:hypothetical protein
LIAAAQIAIFDMAKLQRSSAMRAAHLQQTIPALVIAEEHQGFPKDGTIWWAIFLLGGKANGMPVTAQHLARRSARRNAGEVIIFVF